MNEGIEDEEEKEDEEDKRGKRKSRCARRRRAKPGVRVPQVWRPSLRRSGQEEIRQKDLETER